MKLHVVFQKDGQILAAAQLDGKSAVSARPVADEQAGHLSAVVFVPPEHQHYDLAAVCQRLIVNTGGRFPELTMAD